MQTHENMSQCVNAGSLLVMAGYISTTPVFFRATQQPSRVCVVGFVQGQALLRSNVASRRRFRAILRASSQNSTGHATGEHSQNAQKDAEHRTDRSSAGSIDVVRDVETSLADDKLGQTLDQAVVEKVTQIGFFSWLCRALRKLVAPGGFLWGFVAGLAISAVVLFYPLDRGDMENALREKVTLFDFILQDISTGYVDKVDINKLFESGVNGMLATLDPYTQFENNAEAVEMHVKTSGKYGGVGLGISNGEVLDSQRAAMGGKNRVVVVSAFEGYAFDTGVRPGDVIDSVDGHSTSGMNITSVTELLRGDPGTTVEISVLREGVPQPLTFTLKRQKVQLRDVPVATFIGDKSDGIGYVRLQSFAKDAAAEVSNAIETLMSDAASATPSSRLRGLVLDLRNNPGGLLNAAIEVAESIIPRGSVIVSTKGRGMGPGPTYISNRDPVAPPDLPVAVLVNGQTASASEIVAGAIQDLDRGVIIGSRTFGKGLVQNVQELPYKTALKFTVGRYFTPSGRCIQAQKYDQKNVMGQFEVKPVEEADRKEFLTHNGRTVRDGGGIEPDIMSKHRTSFLEFALQRQNMFFHFASRYAATRGIEELPADFHVDDNLYREFVRFVTNSKFKYESRFDEVFGQLEDMLTDVGYENARGKVSDLRTATEAEMRTDFLRHEDDIKAQLESAIRFRFQPDSVRLVAELRNDEQLRDAVRVLQSPLEYAEILAPKHMIARGGADEGLNDSSSPVAVASSPSTKEVRKNE